MIGTTLKVLSDKNQGGSKVVSIAIALSFCLTADIYNFYLKGQYSLMSTKLVSVFHDHKN